jgi:nucleotide-binding universal stress UspA family protein
MNILAALDQSDRDRLVIERCRRMVVPGGGVVLLHVVSLTKSLLPSGARDAQAYMRMMQSELQEAGIGAEVALRKGDAAVEIVRSAEEYDSDVVIMGTRGRRGIDKFALGSVAEAVLGTCARPVMIMNESTHRSQAREELRRLSGFVAAWVWARQARSELAPEHAELELGRMVQAGLDRATMQATYRTLSNDAIPPEWMDLKFVVQALHQYMPWELAGLAELLRDQSTDASTVAA